MYRRIADFKEDWQWESSATLKVFEVIEEDKKSDKLHENVRSLERLAWHITQTLTEMPHKAGLLESDSLEQQPIPNNFNDIIHTYEQQSQKVLQAVTEKWTDDDLEDTVDMYGQHWTKGRVLSILIRHQAHHRAQMTTLMRLLGMPVPGIYGPSKEEWTQYGMMPME